VSGTEIPVPELSADERRALADMLFGIDQAEAERLRTAPRGRMRPCTVCGLAFSARRSDARLCSDRCRQRAVRARRRG
jgi:hypothetical protein